MDWVTFLTWLGGSSAVSGVIGWVSNRKINKIAADNGKADYAQKLLESGDKLTTRIEKQLERADQRADELDAERKTERASKNEWREKCENALARIHELELMIKDRDSAIAEAKWHECRREDWDCNRRIPPRKRQDHKNTADVAIRV